MTRSLPRHLWPDGHLAQALVLPSATATYERIKKIIDSGEVPACSRNCGGVPGNDATMRECVRYEDGGIMVPFNWLR